MVLRRAFYYWQFIGALVLPIWVLIGRGIVQADQGWDFVFYLVVCPVLFFVMLAVAGLTVARKKVRVARAVSWQDAAIVGVWHISIITYGFLAFTGLAAVIVVLSLIAFWSAAWLLFTETRSRVKEALSLGAIDAGTYVADTYDPAVDTGRVIIINPDGSKEDPPTR
ncbi:MFS transporter [Conyzicola sp.]|uniref:MFS transporter n=1 Tax=Conyzicola sp. TaxID=1969404 RepID=UPI0039890ECA